MVEEGRRQNGAILEVILTILCHSATQEIRHKTTRASRSEHSIP
jgi:hypothetical protein